MRSLSNLPPGVTNAMIEEYFGGDDEPTHDPINIEEFPQEGDMDVDTDDFLEPAELLDVPDHVLRAEGVLVRNSEGIEPIESWATSDLVEFANCIDIELQERAHYAAHHES